MQNFENILVLLYKTEYNLAIKKGFYDPKKDHTWPGYGPMGTGTI